MMELLKFSSYQSNLTLSILGFFALLSLCSGVKMSLKMKMKIHYLFLFLIKNGKENTECVYHVINKLFQFEIVLTKISVILR